MLFGIHSAALASGLEKHLLALALAVIMTAAVFLFWRSARMRRLVKKADEALEDIIDED